MKSPKALYATAFLGWHFLKHVGRRLCGIKSPGFKEFLNFYQADKIVPFSPQDKTLLPLLGRCISCGLCDSSCPTLMQNHLGPSFLPHASRSIPDFAGNLPLNLTSCDACAGCETMCPTGVPIKRLMEFIQNKQNEALRTTTA